MAAPCTTIGSGFAERTDPAALVIGPTGVGLARDGTLYVADILNNRIAANGAIVGPLGLAIAPNGGNGNLVETTPGGRQVAVTALDTQGSPPGAGALFGLAPGDTPVAFSTEIYGRR
jgi:hypothetical protein